MEPEEAGERVKTPSEEMQERIEAAAAPLAEEGRRFAAAAQKLRALAKPGVLKDLTKLEREAAKAEQAFSTEQASALGIDAVLAAVREYVAGAEERIRRGLGIELKGACESAGLGFRVVSREDPVEVRIPPLLLRLDFRRGQADLLFAREIVASTRPDAPAILAAHQTACRKLDTAFVPEEFFDECISAYRAALAATGRPFGDRLEILDFLPYFAISRQSKRFRASPSKETFVPYGKARLAFDVLRLRRAGVLARNGFRINFGVATGTTATQKARVIYLEDEQGDGEYKLTIFFTPTGEQ